MASGILRKYAPDDVIFTIGAMSASGYMKGSWIEVERDVETGKYDIGTDGEATLVISPNTAGKVKLTLQQSSPMNDYLTSLVVALQAKNTTAAIQAMSIVDNNATIPLQAKGVQAFVEKPAKVVFSDGVEGREWTISVPYLDLTPSGESSV